jgi:tetratricopeptide (TPR) repeat protein
MYVWWFALVDCDAYGFAGMAMSNLSFSYFERGRHADALVLREKVLEFRRRVLPEDHPEIGEVDVFLWFGLVGCDAYGLAGNDMNNLANSYDDIGRHEDALVLREKVLEFRRRVLPEEHPEIGEVDVFWWFALVGCDTYGFAGDAMANLANSYAGLGRHEDALVLEEHVLEFRRRVLPKDHPSICEIDGFGWSAPVDCDACVFEGMAMNNLSFSYGAFGRHADALVLREKVLEFRRRVLPEDHPEIGEVDVFWWFGPVDCDAYGLSANAMNNLAITYGALRRYADALVLKEKVLEFRQRVLPEDHPHLGEVDVFWW